MILPANTTHTSANSASAATATASRRFGSASLPASPPGIIEPVMTTGTGKCRSMKDSAAAVYCMVSAPCATTMPRGVLAIASAIASAITTQSPDTTSMLPLRITARHSISMLETESPDRISAGSKLMAATPDLSERWLMVPPVVRTMTFCVAISARRPQCAQGRRQLLASVFRHHDRRRACEQHRVVHQRLDQQRDSRLKHVLPTIDEIDGEHGQPHRAAAAAVIIRAASWAVNRIGAIEDV